MLESLSCHCKIETFLSRSDSYLAAHVKAPLVFDSRNPDLYYSTITGADREPTINLGKFPYAYTVHEACNVCLIIFRRNFGFFTMPEGLPNGDVPQIGQGEVASPSDFNKSNFDETESPSCSESTTDESPKVDVALQIAGGTEHNVKIVVIENVIAGGNEKKNDNPNDVEYKPSTTSGVETQVAHGPTLLVTADKLNVEMKNAEALNTDLPFVSDDNITGDISPEEITEVICNIMEAVALECDLTEETPDKPEVCVVTL